jgi:hypothetical protein
MEKTMCSDSSGRTGALERAGEDDTADDLPPLPDDGTVVTRPGDIWVLDRHRLVCGDSRWKAAVASARPTVGCMASSRVDASAIYGR